MDCKYLQKYDKNMQLLTIAVLQGDLNSGFVYANKALLTFNNSLYEDLFKTYIQMIRIMNHGKKRRIRRDAKKVAGEIITALGRLIQSDQNLENNLIELGEK